MSRLSLLYLAILCGCPASGDEVRPDRDAIFYPTALTVDNLTDTLYVANANSDLRYDSGSVVAADVANIRTVLDAWLGGTPDPACTVDLEQPQVMQCPTSFIIDGARSVRTGNFATGLGVQQLMSGDTRLFTVVRGDPSVTWMDVDSAGVLQCGDSQSSFPRCDDTHRVSQVDNDENLPSLTEEPFSIYLDSGNGYGVVTHLSTGSVSLLKTPVDGEAPVVKDLVGGLFAANGFGVQGSFGVAGRQPGTTGDFVYVSSRTEDRVQVLSVRNPAGNAKLDQVGFFFLNGVDPSDDGRTMRFFDDGARLAILNRDPPTIQMFDTTLSDTGVPKNEFIGAVAVCADAADMAVKDTTEGALAYVACFPSGDVWAVDLQRRELLAVVSSGRGPSKLAIAENHDLLFVANFLEDTVSVIDLTASSQTRNLMVMRIGAPNSGDE